MAASIPHSTLHTLAHNIFTAAMYPNVILNPITLEVEQGDRRNVDHNKVLRAIFDRIVEEGSLPDTTPNDLVVIRKGIQAYSKKISLMQKISGGREQLQSELIQKIEAIISCKIFSIQNTLVPFSVGMNWEAMAKSRKWALQQLSSLVSETCILRAASILAELIKKWSDLRAKILQAGYCLRMEGNGEGIVVDPAMYTTLPTPLLLLTIRVLRSLCITSIDQESRAAVILKIVKAKSIYPSHDPFLSTLLQIVDYFELHRRINSLYMDVVGTLEEIKERVKRSDLGVILDALIKAIEAFDRVCLCFSKKHEADFLSSEKRDRLCQNMANAWAVIKCQIVSPCQQICSIYKDKVGIWHPDYAKIYGMTFQGDGSFADEAHPFVSRYVMGIFTPGSVLFQDLPKTIPTPDEILSLLDVAEAPLLQSFVKKTVDEFQSKPSVLNHQDFLPQHLLKARADDKATKISKRSCVSSKGAKTPPSSEATVIAPLSVLDEPLAESLSSGDEPEDSSLAPAPAVPSVLASDSSEASLIPSIAKEKSLLSSSFSFDVGSGPNLKYGYAFHVSRWFDKRSNPFVEDPYYREKNYPHAIQEDIRFRHTLGLAVIPVVVECGKKFEKIDEEGRCLRKSYTMFADVRWQDGLGADKFARGVVTIGYDPQAKHFFHFCFSEKAPTTIFDQLRSTGYLSAEIDEEPLSYIPEKLLGHKALPYDESRIVRIHEDGVVVEAPQNNAVIELYWM